MLFSILIFTACSNCFSQWQLSLTMKQNETIAGISSPTNNIIWSVTNNFFIYRTSNGGTNWKRVKCNGLAAEISVLQLYVVNASTAFLSVNTNFTGTGPGIIYKTVDSGSNWAQVFSHVGNCEIIIGMFDNKKGIMSCYFSSFDGSIQSGQNLYYTLNGGSSWSIDSNNPSKNRIQCLVTKGHQVTMADYTNFYFSPDRGFTFTTKDKLQHTSSPKYYLQFQDSNYAILNTDNNTDILAKRPGTNGWVDEQRPQGIDNGFITGIVLDDAECWMTQAFDTNKLFYSSDSAKTFTSTIPVPNTGFRYFIKSRKGKTLIGGTPSFISGKIYLNKRQTITTKNHLIKNQTTLQAEQ